MYPVEGISVGVNDAKSGHLDGEAEGVCQGRIIFMDRLKIDIGRPRMQRFKAKYDITVLFPNRSGLCDSFRLEFNGIVGMFISKRRKMQFDLF